MKIFCVISHTHWDREWYMPLEAFRLKLVDLIDRCLETLKKYPEFIFHLDAQTIVLEDYLSIRPGKQRQLKEYISAGRLIVGPWYLQNDFYLTSGEATIRNLLEGGRMSKEYGCSCKVGYAPDQFGNISQLPQILKGFGIDNFVFGRGYSQYERDEQGKRRRIPTTSEFLWKGADGTTALAVHLPFWYNNAQRFSENSNASRKLLQLIERQFTDVATTPYLLLMNGVDHLEAQDNLLPILERLNQSLEEGKQIAQYRLDDYIKQVQDYIKQHEISLPVHQGELRDGHDLELLKGTLSSRSYLKTANVKAQNRLEHVLEPLYAMLEQAGLSGCYSLDHFRYLWKQLMKNHPHDSICGCSRDEVHKHMEDNYARIEEMSNELLNRGLRLAAEHMGTCADHPEDYVIIAVNTTEQPRSGLLEATVEIPLADKIDNFRLVNSTGEEVAFQICSVRQILKDVFSPINLPGTIPVTRYQIRFYVEKLSPYSIQYFLVQKCERQMPAPVQEAEKETIRLENEFLRVDVDKKGAVSLLHKESGRKIDHLLELEETGDAGDSYYYYDTKEATILGSQFPVKAEWVRNHPDFQQCKLHYRMEVPKEYRFEERKRSDQTVFCDVCLLLTLKKGEKALEISYQLQNRAKDHRIRLLVRTGILAENSYADIPFDVVGHCRADQCFDTMSAVRPNTSFALLEEEQGGLAVLTEGTHEYEHLEQQGALAFTLVRSTGVINRDVETGQTNGEQWDCPENQCLRELSGRLGVLPYGGDFVSARVAQHAKCFRTPILTYCTSCDAHKFAGGRPAVQDSEIKEIFFLDDPYKGTQIDEASLLTLQGEGLAIMAWKQAEDGCGLIVRIVNLSEQPVQGTIVAKGTLCLTSLDEQRDLSLGQDRAEYQFKAKEIVSIRITK